MRDRLSDRNDLLLIQHSFFRSISYSQSSIRMNIPLKTRFCTLAIILLFFQGSRFKVLYYLSHTQSYKLFI